MEYTRKVEPDKDRPAKTSRQAATGIMETPSHNHYFNLKKNKKQSKPKTRLKKTTRKGIDCA
jgi:hypothetical protein